jgi:hypothetical protein
MTTVAKDALCVILVNDSADTKAVAVGVRGRIVFRHCAPA